MTYQEPLCASSSCIGCLQSLRLYSSFITYGPERQSLEPSTVFFYSFVVVVAVVVVVSLREREREREREKERERAKMKKILRDKTVHYPR